MTSSACRLRGDGSGYGSMGGDRVMASLAAAVEETAGGSPQLPSAPRHHQANDIFQTTTPTAASFDIMDPLIADFDVEALKRRYNRLQRQEWPRNNTLRAAAVQPLVFAANQAGAVLVGAERTEAAKALGITSKDSSRTSL